MKPSKFETMAEIQQKVEHRQKLRQQRILILSLSAFLLLLMLTAGLME